MALDVIRRDRPRRAKIGFSGAMASSMAALLAASLADPALAQTSLPAAKAQAAPVATAPPADEDDEAPDATAAPATMVKGVTVTARRKPPPQPGAVIGDIKPELQLGPADIQSYGVSTVTELLEELVPETRSDRGRGGETPVILLNGRRISSLNEIQNIPTEAILRVDILPEEVSLKYGYSADQRVVNFVLRRRFRAITGELQGGGPTEGGRESGQAEIDQLNIRGDNRLNLDLKYVGASQITDASRGITEATPSTPYAIDGNITSAISGAEIDPALSALAGKTVTVAGIPSGFAGRALTLGDLTNTANVANTTNIGNDRTLSPATQSLTGNAVLAKPLPLGINATFNGTLAVTTSDSLQGLPGVSLDVPAGNAFSPFSSPVVVDRYVDQPLTQSIDTYSAHLGSTLNRDVSDWRLSLTDAYDVVQTNTETDAGVNATPLQNLLNAGSTSFNPFAALSNSMITDNEESRANSLSNSANIQILANGPIFKLPAGNLYVSVKAGDTQSWLNSTSEREAVDQSIGLTRNDANAQLNVDIPLTSRDDHVLGFLGDFSINFNTAVDQLSDYGTLKAFGYGVNWTPIAGYNIIVSHTNDQAAPTIQQLGNPQISTPNVAVFDYATGQTVYVTQVSGGNPTLQADNRNVFKVGLTIKPISTENLTITANFIKSDIDHAIATFPAADAAIEAAFSSRFIRNASGVLTEEDETPVNFAKSDRTELRWGFNYSRPIGPQPPPRPNRFRGGPGGPNGQRRNPDGSMAQTAAAEPRNGAAATTTPAGPD
ncbi:MAG: TonB-dependent receptor, partial [Caulobacteraceae bacterium]